MSKHIDLSVFFRRKKQSRQVWDGLWHVADYLSKSPSIPFGEREDFRQEMLIAMYRYRHRFDPARGTTPFQYFCMIGRCTIAKLNRSRNNRLKRETKYFQSHQSQWI